MKARTVRAACLVAVASAGIGIKTTPASAAGQYDCVLGMACVWWDQHFQGARFDYQVDVNSLVGYGWNDKASSAFNRNYTHTSSRLWEGADCHGNASETITWGAARAQLWYNDRASALDVYGDPACGW